MARMPSPLFELHLSERDIEVIVDNDEILEGEPVEVERGVYGTPGKVHERLGLEEQQSRPVKIPLSIEPGKRLARNRYGGPLGQPV